MGNYLDKDGLTRFKEKLLTEVDKRIGASGGTGGSGGDAPTKEEILEGAIRVSDVDVDPSVATVEALQIGLTRVESDLNGVVRSVNGASADASGNVTVSYPVTSVNGQTGAVTINVPTTPKAYVTETWSDGTNWYRKYSDGWIEQGGTLSTKSNQFATFSLVTSMTTNTYTIVGSHIGTTTSTYSAIFTAKTTTTFEAKSGVSNQKIDWYACGY